VRDEPETTETISFEKVSLYGIVSAGTVRYRFTVKSPKGTVLKALPDASQKIVFVSRDKGENVKKFVEGLVRVSHISLRQQAFRRPCLVGAIGSRLGRFFSSW
jgi:hypothetical protein